MSVQIPEKLPRGGLSIRELAERAQVSASFVIEHTSEPREVYLARVEQRRSAALRLRAQGLSMRQIAKKIGCSVGSVHNYLLGR